MTSRAMGKPPNWRPAAAITLACEVTAVTTITLTAAPSGAAAVFRAAIRAAASPAAASYSFTTLDDQADPTFNQLLGINSKNVIAGYYGTGATGNWMSAINQVAWARSSSLPRADHQRTRSYAVHRHISRCSPVRPHPDRRVLKM
jgi:hypothetical protein